MLQKIKNLLFRKNRDIKDMLKYPDGRRYYRDQHSLRREQMDNDAMKVVNRLNRNGYRSYLVGGCVRDMLIGKRPKDFDVVTTATPTQIRRIFSNSRTIGRRFRIVHVVFRGKVIEVSTFRSLPPHRLNPDSGKSRDLLLRRDNRFGNPREDAARRDFTINALFFDPRNESIIDYVGGFEDIKNKRIVVIGPEDISFREDPVRMLRAAKFSALLGFEIDKRCLQSIKKNTDYIKKASPSRLLEEYNKIFRTGRTTEVFIKFAETGLLKTLFPESYDPPKKGMAFTETPIGKRLATADRLLEEREELTHLIYFALILQENIKELFDSQELIPNEIYQKLGLNRSNGNSGTKRAGGRRNSGQNINLHKTLVKFIQDRIYPICKRMNCSGKDRERLVQIFANLHRFSKTTPRKRYRPEQFKKKVFFYESFMVYKIHAITTQNEDAIQKAMFWEIGPRTRPPETNKIITTFHPKKRNKKKT